MFSKVRAFTDRHTDICDWKYYHTAFAGGKTFFLAIMSYVMH